MMSKCETKSVMSAVFETREQLDASHKLAAHFGLWWAHSLRPDEIVGLVGMTSEQISELCDRAVERDIADGCDESNWRVDPSPLYTTGTGRTRWHVLPDGRVDIRINRPCGIAISVLWSAARRGIERAIFYEDAIHYRHVAALIHALSALTEDPAQQVWRELGKYHALFSRLIKEEREWEAHASLWEGRATVDPFQWRSSLEVAQ